MAATVVRALASGAADFWLDEIVSWRLTLEFSSAWQVLAAREENNHFLNTWFLYLLGPDAHWALYRLPALIAGVGTVLLSALAAARRGAVEASTAAALVGSSYLMIHYASEARGYSLVIFFSLAAFLSMRRALDSRRAVHELLFALAALLGFLSQLMFVYAYATLTGWSLWRMRAQRWPPHAAAVSLVRFHALPVTAVCLLYLSTIRHMLNVGGPIYALHEVVVRTLSLAAGGAAAGPLAALLAALILAACVAELLLLRREGSDEWILYLGMIVVGPALLLLALQRDEVYVRYFLISVLFLLVVLSQLLGRLYRSGRLGRIAFAALLVAMIAGNSFHAARLLRLGRGAYLETLRWIDAETPGRLISVGSDQDYRNGNVLEYYRRRLEDPERLVYHKFGRWPRGGPEWLLLHSLEADYRPVARIADRQGNRYRLVRETRYAGLSGWHWAVYRNERGMGTTASPP
jgi:hypothetical protein